MSTPQSPPTYWFGSDFHFGHRTVINHCNRPFTDMDHQDRVLVENWNSHVKQGDIAFIIGDFSFYDPAKTSRILKSMNGQKTLVKGNHDHQKDLALVSGWSRVVLQHELRIDGDRICLSHFPMIVWNQCHRGAYHLHGHSHGSMRYPGDIGKARIMDVGIDPIAAITGEYRPMSWQEIKEALSMRHTAYSSDHHEKRY